jgi:hypothetical protein
MPRANKKTSDAIPPEAALDPRVKDPVKFNRIRDLVDKEVLHQAWGCRLWTLERVGKITQAQRKAGDAFCFLTEEYQKAVYGREPLPDEVDRHTRVKTRYADMIYLLTRGEVKIRRAVEELCLQELYPATEADLKLVRDGLTRLEVFFRVGNKS